MKGDYVKQQDHNNNVILEKLHQTQKLHHNLLLRQKPPSPPEPTTFQNPFYANPIESQTSEESDGHNSGAGAAALMMATTNTNTAAPPTTTPNDGGSIEVVRRPRGRPPGSKNKTKQPVIITRDVVDSTMTPTILNIPDGVDIIATVEDLSRKRNIGICVLSGYGTVANVCLRYPLLSPAGNAFSFQGRLNILSLSATVLAPNAHERVRGDVKEFAITLAGPKGQVIGGHVVGALTSAGNVFLVTATYNNPSYLRLPLPLQEEEDEDQDNNNNNNNGGASAEHATGNGVGYHSPSDCGHPPAGAGYIGQMPSGVNWGSY